MRIIVKFSIVLVFVALLILFSKNNNHQNNQKLLSAAENQEDNAHPLKFFEAESFRKSVAQVSTNKVKQNYSIKGGVIPHHLFPSSMIARFFARLQNQDVSTIFLIGPNHHNIGNYEILTSLSNWDTEFGQVEADKNSVLALIDAKLAYEDFEVMSNEHSVAGMMSFIKYFLPEAKVVPIVLKSSVSVTDSEILASKLTELSSENSVIIAPVDFSHYLVAKEAEKNDKVTWQTIKDFNYQTLYRMNNDYLDSPASIGVLLMTMQNLGKIDIEFYENTNSGEMTNDASVPTTSYFSLGFY